ncbi:MAG: CaiB/BaiF CoA transferase family protein [Betaproteobacteria bacterium]|jgi:crotonobetainyl-CoA:carnitine CoA-transferase CaiB-like acyl-CoA transferase|nr:CoA transferase [Burkholderiales bacterium]
MPLPLTGIRVIEFAHMVMGPSCGMVLADLGAEVVKVEPVAGDNTRRLAGSGAGFYAAFNRNKKSLAVDLADPQARAAVLALVARADIVSENFRSGAMDRLGFGQAALQALKPDLIYVSHKGFLAGPYEERTALDEVVQMMAGLAYMTGPPGRPLRAGASVNDIMGGLFGALGAVAALVQRDKTGAGRRIDSGLFENCVYLVAQHMMQFAVTGQPAAPMPARLPAWGIYDVFTAADGTQLFLAVVSDTQWRAFCQALARPDWRDDARLASNPLRVAARDWLLPQVADVLGARRGAELVALATAAGLPWAPITAPEQLFDDPHLQASGGLAPLTLPDGRATAVPLLPLAWDGARLPLRASPPRVGEHTRALLAEAGLDEAAIEALIARGAAAG